MPNGSILVDAFDEIYWSSSLLADGLEKWNSVQQRSISLIEESHHFFLIQGHLLNECLRVRHPRWIDGLQMGNAQQRWRKHEFHTRWKNLETALETKLVPMVAVTLIMAWAPSSRRIRNWERNRHKFRNLNTARYRVEATTLCMSCWINRSIRWPARAAMRMSIVARAHTENDEHQSGDSIESLTGTGGYFFIGIEQKFPRWPKNLRVMLIFEENRRFAKNHQRDLDQWTDLGETWDAFDAWTP